MRCKSSVIIVFSLVLLALFSMQTTAALLEECEEDMGITLDGVGANKLRSISAIIAMDYLKNPYKSPEIDKNAVIDAGEAVADLRERTIDDEVCRKIGSTVMQAALNDLSSSRKRISYNIGYAAQRDIDRAPETAALDPEDLLAGYHLDEAFIQKPMGFITPDIVDEEHFGVLYSPASFCNVEGYFGNACIFNGINDYISAHNDNYIDYPEVYTVSFWARKSEMASSDYMISKGRGMFEIGIEPSNPGYHFSGYIDRTVLNLLIPNIDAGITEVTEWNHYAIVFDFSENSGEPTTALFYTNGERTSEEPYVVDEPFGNGIVVPLTIGKGSSTTSHFKGLIDDVSIWSGALSDQQVRQLYENAFPDP